MKFVSKLALICALCLAAIAFDAFAGSTKFIPTFVVYYGGGPTFVAGDEAKLARYEMIDIDRWRYSALSPTTWAAVKALNPNAQVYLYEMGPEAPSYLDATTQLFLNGLGRYDVSRGHPMGSLNGNNPGLFLLDASGNRIYNLAYSNPSTSQYWHLMDFGGAAYQQYWTLSVQADIATQPWTADGVFADNCTAIAYSGQYSAVPALYPTSAAWTSAMNSFASGIAAGLHGFGQKLWCNRSMSTSPDGAAAWLALDGSATPPDVVLEEGAFAVQWGSSSVQFFPEDAWKRQVDTFAAIRNSRVALMSHANLIEGQSGTDNWGKPVSYWQTLWYSLGSFLLAKNDTLGNAYFMFNGSAGYNQLYWYSEYDSIDLGPAVGPYTVATVGSANVYMREFQLGYVYVNPTAYDAPAFNLPQSGRQLTHDNITAAIDTIPIVTSIALPSHNATIVLRSGPPPDTQAPTVPTGLAGSVASPTQINLTWSASTDNVGVTGYIVYLNGAQLAHTTSTSFSHSGLTPGGTYSYRVSAYDAASNNSAWTNAVTLTTPVPDTTAPSVPTGFSGGAVSQTQINLRWNASTDNVGVTGYIVYLNGAQLAQTASTSFSHTGLTPGATYSYRVSSYDAAANNSAWTNALSLTTPNKDKVNPKVSITSPAPGATVRGTITISANASDNVGVVGVQFKYNGTNLGAEVTSAPYAVPAYTTSVPNGVYTLTAVARDAAGNVTTSAPVSVTVSNP